MATAKVLLVGKKGYIEARHELSSAFVSVLTVTSESALPFVTWTQQLLQVSSLLFKSAQTNIALLFFSKRMLGNILEKKLKSVINHPVRSEFLISRLVSAVKCIYRKNSAA